MFFLVGAIAAGLGLNAAAYQQYVEYILNDV